MEEQNTAIPSHESDQAPETQPDFDQDEFADRPETILKKTDTALLNSKQYLRRGNPIQVTNDTATLGDNREIILVIRGMVERLMMRENTPVILGRADMKTRFVPDVDLTPYGALDRGVSREHSRLHMEGERLYVTDLDSTNGTFLAGKRLEPFTPTVIRKGDELLLGRLAVQVLFR